MISFSRIFPLDQNIPTQKLGIYDQYIWGLKINICICNLFFDVFLFILLSISLIQLTMKDPHNSILYKYLLVAHYKDTSCAIQKLIKLLSSLSNKIEGSWW